jgi:hypothetical protein
VGGVSANLFLNPTEIVRNKQNSYYPAKKSKYLQLDMTGKKLYYRCIQKSNLAPVDYLAFSSPSAPQGLFYWLFHTKKLLRL